MFPKLFSFFRPLLTLRFLKFCAVGGSGVVVNLGGLALFAKVLGLHANLAAALAIEVSIVTNFTLNEFWTFKDRRDKGKSFANRLLRFNMVSLVGAGIQWVVFVAMNTVIAILVNRDVFEMALPGAKWAERWIIGPVTSPPDVGDWMYLSQLLGIAAATLWNFTVNFYWTWRIASKEKRDV